MTEFSHMIRIKSESPKLNVTECGSCRYVRCAGRNYDVEPELQEIQTSVDEAAAHKLSITEAFRTAEAKRGLMIAFGLMIFQQLSGVNAVIFYATDIFRVSIP